MRIFAIGDIHGSHKELTELLQYIFVEEKFDGSVDQLLFIGDYVDRGPHSNKVIETLIELKSTYPSTVFLRGNHEDMFLSYMWAGGNYGNVFIMNGGHTTLLSYVTDELPNYGEKLYNRRIAEVIKKHNVKMLDDFYAVDYRSLSELVPAHHIEFLKQTLDYYESPMATFVHAGVEPGVPLEKQRPFTLYWVNDDRDGYFRRILKNPWHKMLIHGHTPVADEEVKKDVDKNRINLDTGCVFGGQLTCVVVDESKQPKDWKLIQHYGDKISCRV